MFNNKDLLIPQSEHAKLSTQLASLWGNNLVASSPIPYKQFVRGVQTHDRAYPQFDNWPINGMPEDKWLDIQKKGYEFPEEDKVVDVIVKLHLKRIILYKKTPKRVEYAKSIAEEINALIESTPHSKAEFEVTDKIVCFCDSVSYDFCLGNTGTRNLHVETNDKQGVDLYYSTSDAVIRVDPWPFKQTRFTGSVLGYKDYTEEPKKLDYLVTKS